MRLLCRPGVVGGREELALCGDRPDALDELTDLVDLVRALARRAPGRGLPGQRPGAGAGPQRSRLDRY
jgi:hypothetical protein